MKFNGKKERMQHIESKKSSAAQAKQPEFMSEFNVELPNQKNRALNNYRTNYFGRTVKRR